MLVVRVYTCNIKYESCTRAGIELSHQNGISGDDADQDPPKENLEEGDAD